MGETGLTKEFLEDVLKTEILRFESGLGSNLGDGYACAMFKATVWTKAEPELPLHIVVKCFPENETRQAMLDQGDTFEIELRYYDTIIPEFRRLLEELPEEKRFQLPFAPFLHGNYISPDKRGALGRPLKPLDNFLVMPDLREKANGAFRLRDRFLGFDLDHQRLVVEGQATLHAVSWAYKCRKGERLETSFPVLDSRLGELWKTFTPMTGASLTMLTDVFKGKEMPEISESFKRLSEIYFQVFGIYYNFDGGQDEKGFTKDNVVRVVGAVVPNEEPWEALLHGDTWCNNVMFRYDEKTGKPVQTLFIDLQVGREADPMTDLVCSLFVNPKPDVRRKHLTSLLHTYYDRFTEVCDAFSVPYLPGWSWEELNRRFRRATVVGGLMSAALPVILKNPEELVNLDDAMGGADTSDSSGSAGDKVSKALFTLDSAQTDFHPAVLPRLIAIIEDLINDKVL